MSGRKRLGLVIGSGSVKCAAALGLFRVLEREGIKVDLVVGCSAGSLYASTIALGIDAATATDMSRRFWTREVTARSDRSALFRILFPRLLRFNEGFGLKDDRLILRRIHDAFGDRTFADTRIPLYITATDLHSGEQVVLHEGRITDACRASIAIPFAFRPWTVGGRTLIDGFMSDPMPVGVAIKGGADVILAMGFESPYQSRITTAARLAFQLSSIMTNNLLRASFAFHGLAHHDEVIPIIPQFRQRIRLFDVEKLDDIVEDGARAMEEQIPYLHRLLAAAPA